MFSTACYVRGIIMKCNKFLAGGIFSLLLFPINSYSANPWMEGIVSEVVDGDTFKVKLDVKREVGAEGLEWGIVPMTDEHYVRPGEMTIRLSQIDAPEMEQTDGKTARINLIDKIFNKKIRIIEEGQKESPGIMTAQVWFFGENNKLTELNKLLVQEGMAWVGEFSSDEELKTIENDARKNKRGVFTSDNPMSPWMFRGKRKKVKRVIPSWQNCASHKTCREMESCTQAMFYLKKCFRTELDPKRTGIPCENTVCGGRVVEGSLYSVDSDD